MLCCCAADDGGTQIQVQAQESLTGGDQVVKPLDEADNKDDFSYDGPPVTPVRSSSRAGPLSIFSAKAPDPVFEITLKRTSKDRPWGVLLDFADEVSAYVCEVDRDETSVAGAYNASAPEDAQLSAGDYIIGVNGDMLNSKAKNEMIKHLRDLLKSSDSLTLSVVRPYVYDVVVTRKDGQNLGLELLYSSRGGGLLIDKVHDGAVLSCSTEQIKPCDRIISVNNAHRIPENLLRAMGDQHAVLNMQISRPWLT